MSSPQGPPDHCSICTTPWGSPNPRGEIEKPALLPCGHIFGDSCLKIHMTSGLPNWDHTDKRRCPTCDQSLWYRSCKHTVSPRPVLIALCSPPEGQRTLQPAYEKETLPRLAKAHLMPRDCPGCGPAMLPERRRVAELMKKIAVLREKAIHPKNCFAQQIMYVERLSAAEAEVTEAKLKVDTEWETYEVSRRGW